MPSFLVSDQSVNTYRCRLLSAGGRVAAFEANPVMFYMHQRGTVIGKWTNLRMQGDAWYADPVFDAEDGGLGAQVAGKVERGFLKAASMGVCVNNAVYNEALDCCDITDWELQEISIVDIGSNQNALQLYDTTGEAITELRMASFLEQYKPTTTETKTDQLITHMELKKLALQLGLPETATEDQVNAHIEELKKGSVYKTELDQLKLTIQTAKTAEAATLVDQAIADKRIPATMKDVYLKLFAADHYAAKATLTAMPAPQNLVTFAQQGAAQSATTAADDAKRYDELDKAGTLVNLKSQSPDEFKRLYKAKFGSEPTKVFA